MYQKGVPGKWFWTLTLPLTRGFRTSSWDKASFSSLDPRVWATSILQGIVKGGKKTRQTKTEVGRQHQGIDRPGVHQVPEGSGEQRKMEKTGCEVICGAPMTPTFKG